MLQVIAGTTVDIPYTAVQPDGTPAASATVTIRRMDTGHYWTGAAWQAGSASPAMSAGVAPENYWYAWAIPSALPRGTRVRIECEATDCIPISHSVTCLGAAVAESSDIDALETHGDGVWATADTSGIPGAVADELESAFSDIPGAVDDALTASHGSGLWTSALAGDNTLTITVQDGDGNPVGSCPVMLRNAGGQLIGYGLSNASTGVVVYNCNDGEYVATLGPIGGYAPLNPHAVTVSGDTEVSLEVSELSIPTATAPGTCSVYANMMEANGSTPVGAGEGSLTLVEVWSRPTGTTVVYADDSAGDAPGLTDATGQAVLANLPRGATVRIRAQWPDSRSKTVTVEIPDAETYDIGALIQ